ncbi:MAG: alpha-2-macroglobulin family protein [Polyangiales bacterium]
MLEHIVLEANGKEHAVELSPAADIESDKAVQALVDQATRDGQPDRHLVVQPVEPLPYDATVSVVIRKGAPSAEGPRVTKKSQSFSFHTHGPLRLVESQCGWGNECRPGMPWHLRFSNELDADAFDESTIRISPELKRTRADVHGNTVVIASQSKGRTTYEVTVPSTLRDRFGQTLGEEETATFRVGSAHPQLWGSQGMVVLDPAAKKPTLSVSSINEPKLRVQIYRVTPKQYSAFHTFMADRRGRTTPTPPGTKVFDDVVRPEQRPDELVETAIDLSKAFGDNGLGHAVVVVEGTKRDPRREPPRFSAWVQSTRIGLDAFHDYEDFVIWANDLGTGAPLKGVRISVAPSSLTTTTGSDGVASTKLPESPRKRTQWLVAQRGDDVAILPEHGGYWSNWTQWHPQPRGDSFRWFVFTDRGMYRPREEVHFKGWIRRVGMGKGGDVAALDGAIRKVRYTVVGPRGNELSKGSAEVNALGGFDAQFKLPDTPNLGWATIRLESATGGAHGAHHQTFQIQEFRRPEFEVSTKTTPGPYIVGGHAEVTARAAYYAGGPLANADVRWNVTATRTTFTPPGRDEFVFGKWRPWWRGHWFPPEPQEIARETFEAMTDAAGQHTLRVDFDSVTPPEPVSVVAQSSVTDVNRQTWASSATMLVHPSDLYIGVKQDRYFVESGKPIEVAAIVVDQEGNAIAGRDATIEAVRLDWRYRNGEYEEVEADRQQCARTSGKEPFECELETPEGGTYRVTARVVDDEGRANETQVTVWVSGGKQPVARNVEQERITLIPSKKEYAPGDVAEVLLQAPFYPAEGLVTLRRSGIVKTERIRVDGPTKTLRVPIVDGHTTNVFLHVDLVGSAERLDDEGNADPSLPKRVAYAEGELDLKVPPKHRTLSVDVKPVESRLAPGEGTKLRVRVADAKGKPVADSELAVIVVDESVLALSDYQTPNPIAAMYHERSADVTEHHNRAFVKLAKPDRDQFAQADLEEGRVGGARGMAADMAMEAVPASASMPEKSRSVRRKRGDDGGAAAGPTIDVRTNFNALAVFAPAVRTGKDGSATVEVKLPDNLTRYRVMVAAVDHGRQFGHGESSITARLPLMVRPAAPRFLNFGDKFELPIVVQNQTDRAMNVQVAVRATNMALTDGAGRAVRVPPNDRVEIRIPSAAESPGTARFQAVAASGRYADSSQHALPVWTPATTEAFATYGQLDRGVVKHQVKLPSDVVEEFGSLDLSTSSTQLQALTDAYIYLVEYPFACTEQIASRTLGIVALWDVLAAFEAKGLPKPAEIEKQLSEDIEALVMRQNGQGGFGLWRRNDTRWPYISVHATHALVRAKARGLEVPAAALERALDYLQNVERFIPQVYSKRARWAIRAYALYVRALSGDIDLAKAQKLRREAGKELSHEAKGWLLSVFASDAAGKKEAAALYRELANTSSETAATATFASSYSDGAHVIFHSSRRDDAIILDALIRHDPKSDLITKLVRGLLGHRARGRWRNTQENVFVLLALDHYFKKFENVTPDFVARIWLGKNLASEQRFRGRETKRHLVQVPLRHVPRENTDLTIAKTGQGRLYYRLGMTYAPKSLDLEPSDHGFAVERVYEAVDDPEDVKRMPDGTWQIRPGAVVRVRLTMVAEARRYHVALVDPLPAGLEALNPALAVTGDLPDDPSAKPPSARGRWWWWNRTWYEHQNMRDERTEAFTSFLWAGVHEYVYYARATTPGEFVVPPAKAEEMYFPETFGRSASDKVTVGFDSQ